MNPLTSINSLGARSIYRITSFSAYISMHERHFVVNLVHESHVCKQTCINAMLLQATCTDLHTFWSLEEKTSLRCLLDVCLLFQSVYLQSNCTREFSKNEIIRVVKQSHTQLFIQLEFIEKYLKKLIIVRMYLGCFMFSLSSFS